MKPFRITKAREKSGEGFTCTPTAIDIQVDHKKPYEIRITTTTC
jgi:hypothetical protein